MVWATKHFRQYLEDGPAIVCSDCKALKWLTIARDPTSRLAHWAMKFLSYHLIIQHRSSTSNLNTDFLSQCPISQTTSDSAEINAIDSALNILEGTNILDNIRVEQ